jgi:hypothetical protein
MSTSDPLATSRGLRVVLDLENGLTVEDLIEGVRAYAIATDYDGSLNILKRRTGATVDLRSADDRSAVLTWLRQWDAAPLPPPNQPSERRSPLFGFTFAPRQPHS